MEIDRDVCDWLLEEKDPSVRYRTLTELLDRPADDAAAVATRNAILIFNLIPYVALLIVE